MCGYRCSADTVAVLQHCGPGLVVAVHMRLLSMPVFTPLRFLFIVPLLVFWPVLFGGYTASHNEHAIDTSTGYGGRANVITVMDPSANVLDEPSLAFVARHLARGRVPLLNMHNGMGAPQIESLLTGTLYVLNPLLLLLPVASPIYYDLFNILHVYVLLLGAYTLLLWYARAEAAAAVSMLLAFCGVTFLHFNAIHYRSIVWLPLIMAGMVGVVRESGIARWWVVMFASTVACGTAGNVQEFAMCLFAASVIGLCEGLARIKGRTRSLFMAAAGLVFGCITASIVYIPFFAARAQGWVFIPSGDHRSTQNYDPAWIISWIIPKVSGLHPDLFILNAPFHPHPDYSASGFLMLVLGGAAGWTAYKSGAKRRALLALGPLLVIIVGLLKVVHIPLFDFVRAIPMVRDIWFVKYHSYLFVLATIPSAIGLEYLWTAAKRKRRRTLSIAAGITAGIAVLCILWLRINPNYRVVWNAPFINDAELKWYATGLVFVAVVVTLWLLPRRTGAILLGLIALQSMAMLPLGYPKRKNIYGPAWYVSATRPYQRALLNDVPNSNLFFERESFGVTDSVTNDHFRMFAWRFFKLANAGTMLHPVLQGSAITDTQAIALQVAGVERVHGYPSQSKMIDQRGIVQDPFPRAFLISPQTAASLRGGVYFAPENVAALAERIGLDLKTIPQPANIRVEDETIIFDIPERTVPTVLVLNQAYSPNWKIDGRAPYVLADLWLGWDLPPGVAASSSAVYWPAGLTMGIALSAVGTLAATVFFWFVVRKERKS